jgi:hypothetical protein
LAAAADKEPASAAAISVFTSFQSKESGILIFKYE